MSSSAQASPIPGQRLCIAILLVPELNRVNPKGVTSPGAPSPSLVPVGSWGGCAHADSLQHWHRAVGAQASQGTCFLPYPTLPRG